MKGKVVMAITIGIICILLISVMFVQFKSVEVIENSGIGAMRESELREELASWKEKYEEVSSSLEENNKLIEQYNKESQDEQGALNLLNQDLKKANMSLGYTDVKGPGITITLSDGDSRITYNDILYLVNELKHAGAEAISINDKRIVSVSDIVNIQNKFIFVNTERIISPYVVKAIGDSKYLESAINVKGGLKDELEADGKSISYEVSSEVFINKYDGVLEINYGE